MTPDPGLKFLNHSDSVSGFKKEHNPSMFCYIKFSSAGFTIKRMELNETILQDSRMLASKLLHYQVRMKNTLDLINHSKSDEFHIFHQRLEL